MSRVLFLVLHRTNRSPGQRFRHEQYLSSLEEAGYDLTYSNLLNQKQDRVFYATGNRFGKILLGLKTLLWRIFESLSASNYQYIFIYRDAFFFGTLIEWLFSKSRAKLIFDFDDSIWLHDENPGQSVFHRLKDPSKTGKIIRMCDLVIAGNEYLADYARQFNSNVKIIPTTIDTQEYQALNVPKNKNGICVGWSGSWSTIKHFESCLKALNFLKEKYGARVYFKVIGDGNYQNIDLGIQGLPWRKDTELEDLCEIDIGIMPLPDDAWSKGKCGLKGLQYMALEIPTIMSPVGVNTEIIQEGENGFLAATTEEWVEKLSLLIENPELRKKLGQAGRKTVEEKYSVEANKEKWLSVFQD